MRIMKARRNRKLLQLAPLPASAAAMIHWMMMLTPWGRTNGHGGGSNRI
jgi:hypothetical protein